MACSAMRSSGNLSAFLFFVVWVVTGKFTLLSLFLAVIMEAFEVAHEKMVAERALKLDKLIDTSAGSSPTYCNHLSDLSLASLFEQPSPSCYIHCVYQPSEHVN
jgi:hypothetical protein